MAASFGRFVLACLLDRLRTPALGCSFEAALRVHSDGPLRSCFYLSARTPVRSDGRRTQSPFPALAPFTYRASVRRLLLGASPLDAPCTEPRPHLFGADVASRTRLISPALAYVRPTGRAFAIGFRSSHPLRTVPAFSFTRETCDDLSAPAKSRACLLRGVLSHLGAHV